MCRKRNGSHCTKPSTIHGLHLKTGIETLTINYKFKYSQSLLGHPSLYRRYFFVDNGFGTSDSQDTFALT